MKTMKDLDGISTNLLLAKVAVRTNKSEQEIIDLKAIIELMKRDITKLKDNMMAEIKLESGDYL